MKTRYLVVCAVVGLIALSATGRWTENQLRAKAWRDALNAGVELTNVWMRVDINRKLLTTGGSMSSTQDQHRYFISVTNSYPFLMYINQSITTPEKSIYPAEFAVGYNPYENEKDTRAAEAIAAFTNALLSTENRSVTNTVEAVTNASQRVTTDKPAADE